MLFREKRTRVCALRCTKCGNCGERAGAGGLGEERAVRDGEEEDASGGEGRIWNPRIG
jgi:hypothetical protein